MPVIKLPSDNVGNIVAVIKSEADLNVFFPLDCLQLWFEYDMNREVKQ